MFLRIISIILFLVACGDPQPKAKEQKITIIQDAKPNCDGKEIGVKDNILKCEEGYLGTITSVCTDKGGYATWEVLERNCYPAPSKCEEESKNAITYDGHIQEFMTNTCVGAGCHIPGQYDTYENAIIIAKEAAARFILGDSNNRRMPPPPRPALDGDQIELWNKWMEDGYIENVECPDPEKTNENFNSNESFIRSNLDAALALDNRGQEQARFVTCDTKYNYGASKDDLESCRAAINDAINAVSDRPIMQVCSDVDLFKGSCRIDLENIGLTPLDWEYIVREASLVFVDNTNEGILLREITKTDVPALTVDQFVEGAIDNATNYYNFLGISENLWDYFESRGIDFNQEVRDFRAKFSGMSDSEVSARKNRLTVFLDSDNGQCSITFDPVDAAREDSNLAQFPLVVIGEKQFFFDASETICTMENGGQEYALWNREGKRQNVAPTNIVVDYRSGGIHGDFEIKNAAGCFGCHRTGLNLFAEQIRDAVISNAGNFSANDIQAVRELYLTQTRLDTLIAKYNEEFKENMKSIGVDTRGPDDITRWFDEFKLPWGLDQLCGHIRLKLDECKTDLETTSVAGDLAPLFNGGTIAKAVFDRLVIDKNNNNVKDPGDLDVFDTIVIELRIGEEAINGFFDGKIERNIMFNSAAMRSL